MEKKVSVIVPVYRTLEWLARCVQSITGQTYKNLEIILVDDGSPDDCPALCDDWAQRDDRIRVLHKENGGLVSAWMAGVSMSTGDYLCFVDSDDWIDACMVEKMLDFSSDCGKEIICGNYVQEERNRSIEIYQAMEPGIYTGRSLQDRIHGKLLGQEKRPITLSRCMKLFSRTLIVENMNTVTRPFEWVRIWSSPFRRFWMRSGLWSWRAQRGITTCFCGSRWCTVMMPECMKISAVWIKLFAKSLQTSMRRTPKNRRIGSCSF